MTVGTQDLVEIRRDSDFVVGKILQPGAVGVIGIGENLGEFRERDADGRFRQRRNTLFTREKSQSRSHGRVLRDSTSDKVGASLPRDHA